MRYPARERALGILLKVEREGVYAQLELKRGIDGLSDEDKRLAARLVYGTLEKRLFLDYVIDKKLKKPKLPPLVREILRIGAYQLLFSDGIPDYAAISSSVDIVKARGLSQHAGLVNAVLRSISRDGVPGLPDAARDEISHYSLKYCYPRILVELFMSQWGRDSALSYMSCRPDGEEVSLRFSPSASERNLQELLSRAKSARKSGSCPDIWHVKGMGDITALEEYRSGTITVQSEGSRLAAQAVCAKPGMRILDACAAPGGKSFALAHDSGDLAEITAWDIHPHRVKLIESGAKRLGLRSVKAGERDAREHDTDMDGLFDAVLVDAPCSGLGVISGKPEILLRFTLEAEESLCALQRELLNTCSRYVKPGGALIYSTCTVLRRENEEQVDGFLAAHPDFSIDAGYNHGTPLLLRPDEGANEGFFIARMVRGTSRMGGG